MEDAAKYSDEIIVMHKGTIEMHGTPREVFSEVEKLTSLGLDLPETVKLQRQLMDKGLFFDEIPLTIDEAVNQIKAKMKVGVRNDG
jgi:energy-coupling factor transport system ATP-binding protein